MIDTTNMPWSLTYDDEIRAYLDAHPPEQRRAAALALSARQWHPDNPKRGMGECALCVQYGRRPCPDGEDEGGIPCFWLPPCPLVAAGQHCDSDGSLWRRWWNSVPATSAAAADELYALLVRLMEEE